MSFIMIPKKSRRAPNQSCGICSTHIKGKHKIYFEGNGNKGVLLNDTRDVAKAQEMWSKALKSLKTMTKEQRKECEIDQFRFLVWSQGDHELRSFQIW